MQYVICGDTKNFEGVLVYTCGTEENAKKVLKRMLTNPNEQDKRQLEKHTNLRVEPVKESDCWWSRYGCD